MLVLGGLEFEGFEIPEALPMGGKQALVVHRTIGGRRVIDAMGPDDAPISWSGHFLGEQAQRRALRMDLLRRSGRVVELEHGLRRYRVVVSEFTARVEQPYVVPYTITCEILEDLVAGEGGTRSQSLEEAVQADLEMAEAAAAERDAMIAAVNLVRNTIQHPSSIKGLLRTAGGAAVGELRGVISEAVGQALFDATAADIGLAAAGGLAEAGGAAVGDAVGGAVGSAVVGPLATPGGSMGGVQRGGDPPTMAARMQQTSTDADTAYAAQVTGASMTRLRANVDQVPP